MEDLIPMCDKDIRDLNEDPDSPKIFACEYIVVELDDDDNNTLSEFDRAELSSLLESANLVNEGPPRLQDDEKEEMKPLIKEVSSILFECDPMCLDFGTNSDEYDFVADTVVLFLKHKETVDDVIEAIISSIKCWFSSDLSGYKTNDKFISMSQRIWEAWSEYQRRYDRFFKNVECVREKQNKQKSRGLNDYNIFTSILKAGDEVRLHSRFIHSLLNPDGSHYQGTLFLEKFIKAVGLEEFGLNLDQAHVRKEHKEIDLYITDGEKHIIIENKIWAEDQKDQITRYINTIVRDGNVDVASNEESPAIVDEDYVRVIYLTVRDSKRVPDGHSLIEKGRYIVSCNDQLDEELTNYQARYHRITYKTEIMGWLNASQNEVKNLTNMNLAIEQYKEVIRKLYRTYKGKVMTLESYLFESEKTGVAEDKIRLALSIEGELIRIKARVISEFFTHLYSKPVCGQQAEYYFLTKKTSSNLNQKYIERWIQGERGLKDFGLKWALDDDQYVTVFAGMSHIHIGVRCSKFEFRDNHDLFGSFEPRKWKDPFFGYDLGLHGLKNPDALMESHYPDVENVLTALCEKLRGV